MEVKKSTAFRVPVLLFDSSTGLGKTGITYSGATVYLQKQAGSSAQKSLTSGDWFEIDSTNFPGVYDILLSTSDTDTEGNLKYSVQASGCDMYVGMIDIVGALSVDVLKVNRNRWKIDTSTKKLYIYDDNGTTVLYEFDLKNSSGSPDASSIFERVPV